MKKSNLVVSIIYILLGIGCLIAGNFIDNGLDGLLFGFSGAGLGSGCISLYKYFYWNSPKHEKEYKEKLKNEQIELHDELKEKLRDKSGRCAYILGLVIVAVSMPVFIILHELGIIENGLIIIAYLFAFLIVEDLAGIIIFKYLLGKYR